MAIFLSTYNPHVSWGHVIFGDLNAVGLNPVLRAMGDPTFLGTFPWVGGEGCLCVCLLSTQDSTFLCPVSQFCLRTLLLASWARDLCSYIGPTFGFVLCCHLELDF